MVRKEQQINLVPLVRWLVSAARTGYGLGVLNGLGWRLPNDFGTCFAGDSAGDVLKLYCAIQEAAWLRLATGFVPHGQAVRFLFGEVSFLLPLPPDFLAKEIQQVVLHENCFPFEVLKKINLTSVDQLDPALIGPLFIFHSR